MPDAMRLYSELALDGEGEALCGWDRRLWAPLEDRGDIELRFNLHLTFHNHMVMVKKCNP
jgi:hypothetical protein